MRQARALQDLGRQQLVVRREQRARAVEHDDAARGQRAERPEAVFDAVERVDDVQPAQRNRPRLEQRRRLLRDEDARVDPVRRRRGKGRVRGSTPLGDDREQHDIRYRRNAAIRGLWEVKIRQLFGVPLRMRSVSELAELAGDEVRGLLADVDGMVADPLEAARDEDHPQPPLAHLEVAAELEQAVDDSAVGAVDQLVELEQRLGCDAVPLLERAERNADHLLGALAHLLEALEQLSSGGRSFDSFVSFAIVTQSSPSARGGGCPRASPARA